MMQRSIGEDKEWDDYLKHCSLGQFQQSAMWARFKETEGWRPERIVFKNGDSVTGGLQALIRNTTFGAIGYVSKGPVLLEEDEHSVDAAVNSIFEIVNGNSLKAIVVLPPDDSSVIPEALMKHDFVKIPMLKVIDSTLLLPVDGGEVGINKSMNHRTRNKISKGVRRGVTVREGRITDIPMFFGMMEETCKRQGEKNLNPGSVEALENIWHAFNAERNIRLTFAEINGEPVAGMLCILFGDKVTIWKKGWTGKFSEFHPNDVLHKETFVWAFENGYSHCDFAGLNRKIAERLVRGNELTDQQKSSRDAFNLQFGGAPKLLPGAVIYIRNQPLRHIFRSFSKIREAFSFQGQCN